MPEFFVQSNMASLSYLKASQTPRGLNVGSPPAIYETLRFVIDLDQGMSVRGQKRKNSSEQMFSALPLRTDIARCSRHVRFVPINRHGPPFFDHVVSATNGPLNSDESVFALHASADLPKLHSAPLGFRDKLSN
jgi:hypothetical protein